MAAVRVALLRDAPAGTRWPQDARRAGARVLTLDGGDPEVGGPAHESLVVAGDEDVDLDIVQHLVSAAAGENGRPPGRGRRTFRDRLARPAG